MPFAMHGEPAVLLCNYSLDPNEVVAEVEWHKDGSLVYVWTSDEGPEARGNLTGKVDLKESTSSRITIEKVHKDMAGKYTCYVRTNGKVVDNHMELVVIVDACGEDAWKTNTNMIECTEDLSMHCVGIFPKPSPSCGVYSERTGKFLNSIHFDSVNYLHNGTWEVSFNRRFSAKDWLGHPDLSFRCHMVVLGTPWRSGLVHKMFGDPGCEKDPQPIKNGYFNVTGDLSCWGYPSEDSTAEYFCHEPYAMQGPAQYKCKRGSWVPKEVTSDETKQLPICSDGSGASILQCSWCVVLFAIFCLSRTSSAIATRLAV